MFFFFNKILLHDYPKVVVEAQKALYNIVLTYSSKKNFEEEISTHVIVTLENQLDLIVGDFFYYTLKLK